MRPKKHQEKMSIKTPHLRLSKEQCQELHEASLEILERIGVCLQLPEALDLLKKAGAKVFDDGVVRIPRRLVERAFQSVPQQVALYDRQGKRTMPLGEQRCFYGPGSDCHNILDHKTGVRRNPMVKDVAEGARLCDALPSIDFLMSMVLPKDVNQAMADTYQIEALLSHSTKPVLVVSYELAGIINAVDMAKAILGGPEALRHRPNLACYINLVSGSFHNRESLQKLLYLSGEGIPFFYIPASTPGATSPITVAGSVALDNAGVLLGLVLSQLNREGAPYIMSGMEGSPLDMRTMVSTYAYPERGFFEALGHHYGMPMFALSGASESKIVDQQAAAEAALTLMADTFGGGHLIHDLGYLESGNTFSFVQLVICDQIVDWIKAFFRDIEISKETLALDLIEKVGPKGSYLSTEHTLKHFREQWYPDLFERGSFNSWVQSGSRDLGARAAARVDQILEEHHPEPLPEDVRAVLRKIVERTKTAS
jgi:trimethylamine--corrinoid protein Co-methyltransferase